MGEMSEHIVTPFVLYCGKAGGFSTRAFPHPAAVKVVPKSVVDVVAGHAILGTGVPHFAHPPADVLHEMVAHIIVDSAWRGLGVLVD